MGFIGRFLDSLGEQPVHELKSSDWILSKPIAHRGLHCDKIPENSLAAFQAAIDAGYPIEIDVQLTKDKVPVVYHDDTLNRLTGLQKRVTKAMCHVVSALKIADTDQDVPTFKEVLDLIAGKVPLLIEIKRNKGSRGIERIVLDALKDYKGKFAIQSFNPMALRKVRKIDPSIYCGLLSSKLTEMKMLRIKRAAVRNARLFFLAKPDFVSFEINSFPNDRVKRFREELQLPIIGWTVKTKEDIERALEYCDGIIFENIENLQENFSGFAKSEV